MKTSYVLSVPPGALSGSTAAPQIEAAMRRLGELGFDGVELHLRDPKSVNGALLKRLTEASGLKVCAIGTGAVYTEEGLCFSHPDECLRGLAIDRVMAAIDLAARFRAVVIIGLVRGRVHGTNAAWDLQRVEQALRQCIAAAEGKKVRLVVEPINRYETSMLNTVAETVEFVKGLGSPNVGLLLDTFHMNIEEPCIVEAIKQAGKLIGHVHTADSNRWAPGYGHLDFGKIAGSLNGVKYTGYLSAEVLPLPDPDSAAETAARTLKSL